MIFHFAKIAPPAVNFPIKAPQMHTVPPSKGNHKKYSVRQIAFPKGRASNDTFSKLGMSEVWLGS